MGRTLIIFFRSSRALRPLEKSEVEMEHIPSAYGEVMPMKSMLRVMENIRRSNVSD